MSGHWTNGWMDEWALGKWAAGRVGVEQMGGWMSGLADGFPRCDSPVEGGNVIAVADGAVASSNSCGQQQRLPSTGRRLGLEPVPKVL